MMENLVKTEECCLIKKVEENRVMYFDILNILACICVIFLHMNGIVHNYTETRSWKTALIFEVICYWAVPVFIMLSGATLFKYRERYDTKTFFKKRFLKVLIPWIVWSMILYIINNKNLNILQFIEDFIYCRIEGIYWFMPLILYLYCIIPIFSFFTERQEQRNVLRAIVIFIFIFRSILEPLCIVLDIEFPTIFNYCLAQNSYIIFLLLGYLLSTSDLNKRKRIIIYVLGILSVLIRYGYTYYFSIQESEVNRNLFDYCGAVSVLLAVAVFVFIKQINWNKIIKKIRINPNILGKISSCSLGIYLIHMLVKNKLTNLLHLDIHSIYYRTLGAMILYLICLVIVYIIKKVPTIKKIVP